MAVEYIVSGEYGSIPGPLVAENMNRVIIDRRDFLSLRASARYVPGGLWNWKQLSAKDLRDCWDDTMAFRS